MEQSAKKVSDAGYKCEDFPNLENSQALERAKKVVLPYAKKDGKEPSNPLPALAEIVYLHTKGKIEDEIYEKSVKFLIGEENGNDFLTGNEKAREQSINQWLPPNWDPEGDLSDEF